MSSDNFSSSLNTSNTDHPPTNVPIQPAILTSKPDSSMAAAAVNVAPPAMHETQQPRQDEPRQDLPRPYKCPLCDKAFHRLEHQTRHIRTHTGEKPHACQYPGCQKRFSRSDELTRHSRIHSNPNSRRGKAANNVHAALAFGQHPDGQIPYMMQAVPQPIQYPNTAPNSNLASPNVSPPHSYVPYHTPPAYQTPSSYGSYSRSGYESPSYPPPPQAGERGINLLATAASQVEVERSQQGSATSAPPSSFHPQRRGPSHHVPGYHPYSHSNSPAAGSRLPSLSAYAYSSHSMSRSNSQEKHMEDPYAHALPKRSRPPSPQYTNPHSPHSGPNSTKCSPTPGHTPAITPGHSPRLAPEPVHLPSIRSLNIQHHGLHPHFGGSLNVPDTLEPTADINHNTSFTNNVNSSYGTPAPGSVAPSAVHSRRASLSGSPKDGIHAQPYSRSQNTSFKIADIVNHGQQGRTLPVPRETPSQSGTSTPARGGKGVGWMLNEQEEDADRMDES